MLPRCRPAIPTGVLLLATTPDAALAVVDANNSTVSFPLNATVAVTRFYFQTTSVPYATSSVSVVPFQTAT